MPQSRLISIDQPTAWDRAVVRCGRHDTYHLAGYHRLAEQSGEGEPYLLFFEDAGRMAALPFLRRPVANVPGLECRPDADATSVYGYPGVVTAVRPSDAAAEKFRWRFQAALGEVLTRLGAVVFFTRQNPLIDTSWMLQPMAQLTTAGPTAAIDLRLSEEEQLRQFRTNHRRDIHRARREGIVVREDPSFEQIGQFTRLYRETMDRVGARDYYYFPDEYFARLKENLPQAARLVFSEQDGQIISGALFLVTDRIIQYHLGGTATEHQNRRGAIKLIFNHMRAWGTRNGMSWLHLGGGLGAREDSLFRFKAGFSDTRFQFQTASLVLNQAVYQGLIGSRQQWTRRHGQDLSEEECFPEYRRAPLKRSA
jgi:hypothetical protein